MIEDPKPPGDLYSDTGSEQARARLIDRLFREHNDSLLRFLAARLGSRQEAHEIAQEAYVRLLKLDTPGAVSYLRAFLFKTASNLAIDRLRTRSYRERPATLEFFERLPSSATPERQVSGEQEMRELHRLLGELPPKCRYAFVMNRFHGMDVAWLSNEMRMTETMVRRYISRALIHCRAGLDVATGTHHDKE
jgi:RNA polymerase sigma factor (sigma-70 family)